MSLIDDLKAEIATVKQQSADQITALNALIASDAANFQALKDALAANDPAAIQQAIADLEATRVAMKAATDATTAADAADNL